MLLCRSARAFNISRTASATVVAARNYAKQRKINLAFKSPWDMLEDAKKKFDHIPRLADVNQGQIVTAFDPIMEQNIKNLEELKKKNYVPGDAIVDEEPDVKKYVDWVRAEKPKAGEWTPHSKRCGAIAIKVGMFPVWDEYDQRLALTALWIPKCQVTQVKTEEKEGYTALQIGAGQKRMKKTTKPLLGHFTKAGVEPKIATTEVRVTPDAILPVGTEITARHFLPGQFVDIVGRSTGKGFAGPMKRWGFGGLSASHGVSISHRSHGSTGNRTEPGRTFKGKKMAGRLGGKQVYVHSLHVHMVDPKSNVVFVKGSVPGKKGSFVLLKDAQRKVFTQPPPFPTFVPPAGEDLSTVSVQDALIRAKGIKPGVYDIMNMSDEQLSKAGTKKGGKKD